MVFLLQLGLCSAYYFFVCDTLSAILGVRRPLLVAAAAPILVALASERDLNRFAKFSFASQVMQFNVYETI